MKATGSRANGKHIVDLLVELSDGQNSWCSATVALGNRHCHLHLRLFLQRQVHLCNFVNTASVRMWWLQESDCLFAYTAEENFGDSIREEIALPLSDTDTGVHRRLHFK